MELLIYTLALGVPVVDRLPGIFFHPASTSITAYGIATKRTTRFYMVAVALHFANNFLALSNTFTNPISTIVVGITVAVSLHLRSKTKEKIVN